MPKRAAEDGADASTKKAKKAPKNVGDDIIKLESDSEGEDKLGADYPDEESGDDSDGDFEDGAYRLR